MKKRFELTDCFATVRKPSRYIDHEVGARRKPWDGSQLHWCLAFPDVYEIGISHTGLGILYNILNNRTDTLADRVYSPWPDMEDALKNAGEDLFGIETRRSLSEFDIIGITIPYEMTYTNILNILKLAELPLLSRDRDSSHPLIVGGGVGAFNPEPLADFFDVIVLGDGEPAVDAISDVVLKCGKGTAREDLLEQLAKIDGVYVPSFFEPSYGDDGLLTAVNRKNERVEAVKRSILPLLDSSKPFVPIIPYIQSVHDRVSIEIQRGCTRGCRFCQAGYTYRPVRQRSKEETIQGACDNINATGYEDLSFLSLSAGDYAPLPDVIRSASEQFGDKYVSISLPSLRVESLTPDVLRGLKGSRSSGFTLAPEAATQRLRNVINKCNTQEDLLRTVETIFAAGFDQVKLYFMIGLPTETDEDIRAIADLSNEVLKIGRARSKRVNITVSVSTFVPKPHTPFQWEPQISIEESIRRQTMLKELIRGRGLDLKWHDPNTSYLEGLFSRGDRRLGNLLMKAHSEGARFDSWDEFVKVDRWKAWLAELNIDPKFYIERRRGEDEVLPWDHLFADLKKTYLLDERHKAVSGEATPDCAFESCTGCGVCDFKEIKPVVHLSDGTFGEQTQNHIQKQKTDATVQPESHRYRMVYSKEGDLAWVSHLELMNVLRRAVRRAELPIRYSEGFHPQARISMGTALSVGVESACEMMDMLFSKTVDPAEIQGALNKQLPEGIRISSVSEVIGKVVPLEQLISDEKYRVNGLSSLDAKALQGARDRFMDASSFPVKLELSKGTIDVDARAQVIALDILESHDIELNLKRGNLKPWDAVSNIFGVTTEEAKRFHYHKIAVTYVK